MPIEFSAESPLTRGIAYDSRRFAWILVPLHSSRRVTVSGTAGMTPFRSRLEDELLTYHVAGINFVEHGSGDRRVLEIRGTRPGLAAIDYAETPPQGRDQDNPRLIVSVKRKRLINAAFHYVKGGIWQRTHRKPNQLDSLLNGVNRILEPQANVRVVCKSRRWLPTRPLGFRVIETPKKYEHGRVEHRGIKRPERFAARRERAIERAKDDQRLREYSYLKGLGDPHADLNVFFVRRAQVYPNWNPFKDSNFNPFPRSPQDPTDKRGIKPRLYDVEAWAGLNGNNMLMEDQTFGDAEVFAHEILHHLGLDHPDDVESQAELIAPGQTGKWIPRRHADRINRTDQIFGP